MKNIVIFTTLLILSYSAKANNGLRENILSKLKQSKTLSSEYVSAIIGNWKGTCVAGTLESMSNSGYEKPIKDMMYAFESDGTVEPELSFDESEKVRWNNRRISTKAEQLELTISTQDESNKGLVYDHIIGLNLITEITRFTLFNKIANVAALPPLDPFIEIHQNRTMAVYPVTIPEGGTNFDHEMDLRILDGVLYTVSRFIGSNRGGYNSNLDIICKLRKQ